MHTNRQSNLTTWCVVLLLVTLGADVAGGEPAVVANGSVPRDGVVTAELTELWRVGGEDDDVFFGSVARITSGSDGEILVLDGQLSEVHVFGRDGSLLRTIGREGDGPGEVRRANDMFLTTEGAACLLQGFPGRIVKLHPDGTPAGETAYTSGEPGAGQFSVMVRGLPQPDGMLLAGISMGFTGPGQSNQDFFLDLCDNDGKRRKQLLTKTYSIDYNDFVMDELGMDFVWSRVALGPTGQVYTAPERNAYAIEIYATDGTLLRKITRDYVSPPRSDAQAERAKLVLAAVGANYPTPPKRITIEETQPVLADFWVTDDQWLWVLTGDEQPDRADGTWAGLDVFDPAGVYVRHVLLPGSHDQTRDAIYLLPDRRLLVVVGSLDAYLSQQAVSDEQHSDADPLEIICYQLSE